MRNRIWRALQLSLLGFAALSEAQAVEVEPCAEIYEAEINDLQSGGQTIAGSSVYGVLSLQLESGCILGEKDSTGIRQLYTALPNVPDEKRAKARADLFDAIEAQLEGLPSSTCANPGDPAAACIVGRQLKSIRDVRELLEQGNPPLADPKLSNNNWTVVTGAGRIPISGVALQPLLATECAEGALTPRCRTAVDLAAKLMRSALGTFQAISAHARPTIEGNAEFLSKRDKEWNSYFNDISVQYPWELGFNGWWFQKKTPAEERRGFPRAPARKFIALHPAVGFEYAEGIDGKRTTQGAVVLEVFGYERWHWKDGKAAGRVGASLAISFTDVVGADSVGYGMMFHTPYRNMSMGAVWRDGDSGESVNFIFNLDPSSWINHYRNFDLMEFIKAPAL